MLRGALTLDRHPPLPLAVSRPSVTKRLRRANLAIAVVHLVQAFLVLAVASDSMRVVSRAGSGSEPVATLSIGAALATIFVVLAVTHASCGSLLWRVYLRDLSQGRNSIRWAGMHATAPLTMVLIALLAGIDDLVRLWVVGMSMLAMVIFGSMQERLNPPGGPRTTMVPLVAAITVGLIPWLMVLSTLVAGTQRTYGASLFVALFVLWSSAWINTMLQYRQAGPWADYLYGERTALFLSLVVNSALAWQIVAAAAMR